MAMLNDGLWAMGVGGCLSVRVCACVCVCVLSDLSLCLSFFLISFSATILIEGLASQGGDCCPFFGSAFSGRTAVSLGQAFTGWM